jgi:tripartite ATP-independent transporter DctM subunit
MSAIVVMVILFLLSVPVAYAVGIGAFAAILLDPGFTMIWMAKIITDAMASFPLLAVPFFILAAEFMNTSTITGRIFEFANQVVGHWRGGLAHVNVLASLIFSGMSGSAVADAAGLGQIEIKAMRDEGYKDAFSAAITAASATIGPIVPPSIPFVVYGYIGETSIGRLLLAGAVPGFLMAFLLMGTVAFIARARNYPYRPRPRWGALWKSFKRAFLPLLTPCILLGGILMGVFTPTEAAVVAAAYGCVIATFVYRDLTLGGVWKVFVKSGILSGKILIIAAFGNLLSVVLSTQLLPQRVAAFTLGISSTPWVLLLYLNIFLLVVGCLMDALGAMIIIVPIIIPIMMAMHVDPVHLGVIVVLNLMVGLVTPPYGISMFITCEIANCSVQDFVRESLPFYAILFGLLLMVTYIPSLSLWLPNLVLGR